LVLDSEDERFAALKKILALPSGAESSGLASNENMEARMYVILGASGNTGHVVADHLLSAGKKVRVVARNPEHLQFLATKGGEVFVADITDAQALTRAFHGADAIYAMIPPNPASNNPQGHQEKVSDAIAKAVKDAGVKKVVSLSSIGADKPSGTGPVVGLHNFEEKLNKIEGANVLHLRAGYFMENTLPQVGAIRTMGFVAGPLRGELKLPMIASRDIGEAAADELLKLEFRGKQTRELHGQRDVSYNDVAAIIGHAIGKSELKYVHGTDDQVRGALMQSGMSQSMAGLILEMASALNSGQMRALEPRTARNTTKTSYESFVSELFVPAYRQQAAA
jgi:uncharacterized protein YbjT (DUF2867 family)